MSTLNGYIFVNMTKLLLLIFRYFMIFTALSLILLGFSFDSIFTVKYPFCVFFSYEFNHFCILKVNPLYNSTLAGGDTRHVTMLSLSGHHITDTMSPSSRLQTSRVRCLESRSILQHRVRGWKCINRFSSFGVLIVLRSVLMC